MAVATDVLNPARGKLRTVESPPESNNQMFGIWYGFNKVPWCAIFVSWCMAQAGVQGQYRNASVAFSLDTARKQGRRTGEFRAGFVACRLNDPSGEWGPGHTGIVEAVHSNGEVTTIEGNTSPGDGGSQRDGGGVWRRRRPKSYWNRQCIRIDYSGASTPPPPPAAPAPGGGLAVDGDFGPNTIKALQVRLNNTGANPRLGVDGDFGPSSKKALQARLNHVAGPVGVDGDVGPQTIKALQRHVGVAQDGEWGPNTTMGLQRKLNSGSF